MNKHFFFLIMNVHTYATYYTHAGVERPEDFAELLNDNEVVLMCWEASPDAIHFDKPLTKNEKYPV